MGRPYGPIDRRHLFLFCQPTAVVTAAVLAACLSCSPGAERFYIATTTQVEEELLLTFADQQVPLAVVTGHADLSEVRAAFCYMTSDSEGPGGYHVRPSGLSSSGTPFTVVNGLTVLPYVYTRPRCDDQPFPLRAELWTVGDDLSCQKLEEMPPESVFGVGLAEPVALVHLVASPEDGHCWQSTIREPLDPIRAPADLQRIPLPLNRDALLEEGEYDRFWEEMDGNLGLR